MRIPSVMVAAVGLAFVACGHATLIQRDRSGGVVELGSGRDARDYEKAHDIMNRQCGSVGAEIVSEGEEPVGIRTSAWGARVTTAWRVHYRCDAAPID